MSNKNLDLFQIVRNGDFNFYRNNIIEYDIDSTNDYGQSLLHEAIAYKQSEIAIDLIGKSINVNLQDDKGQTVLHYIGFHPNILIAEKIIENGGSLELCDLYGNTPLWYAVFNARGNYGLVELFIKYGANPNLKNKAGRSPFDFAVQIKDEKLLEIIQKQKRGGFNVKI